MVAAQASKFGDQLHVFQIAIGLERSPSKMRTMLNLAAEHSIPFVESALHKMSTLPPQMSQMFPRDWYNDLVSHFLKTGGFFDELEFFLARPEWNPGSIESLLRMMGQNNRFSTRLGQEFLNPRLTFQAADRTQISGGVDALNSAIRQSEQGRGLQWYRLEETLKAIRDGEPI
jgi:hypothetical protein